MTEMSLEVNSLSTFVPTRWIINFNTNALQVFKPQGHRNTHPKVRRVYGTRPSICRERQCVAPELHDIVPHINVYLTSVFVDVLLSHFTCCTALATNSDISAIFHTSVVMCGSVFVAFMERCHASVLNV